MDVDNRDAGNLINQAERRPSGGRPEVLRRAGRQTAPKDSQRDKPGTGQAVFPKWVQHEGKVVAKTGRGCVGLEVSQQPLSWARAVGLENLE